MLPFILNSNTTLGTSQAGIGTQTVTVFSPLPCSLLEVAGPHVHADLFSIYR